jgi:hypothetical protein
MDAGLFHFQIGVCQRYKYAGGTGEGVCLGTAQIGSTLSKASVTGLPQLMRSTGIVAGYLRGSKHSLRQPQCGTHSSLFNLRNSHLQGKVQSGGLILPSWGSLVGAGVCLCFGMNLFNVP